MVTEGTTAGDGQFANERREGGMDRGREGVQSSSLLEMLARFVLTSGIERAFGRAEDIRRL